MLPINRTSTGPTMMSTQRSLATEDGTAPSAIFGTEPKELGQEGGACRHGEGQGQEGLGERRERQDGVSSVRKAMR